MNGDRYSLAPATSRQAGGAEAVRAGRVSEFRISSITALTACAGLSLFLAAGCVSTPEKNLRYIHAAEGRALAPAPEPDWSGASLDEHSTFDDYIRRAFAHNPGLRAAFERWAATLEKIPQARSLGDPTLSFEYFVQQMDARYRVSLTQMIPAFGKRGLREDAAVAEARAAWHLFEAERFALLERLAKSFYNYHYLALATAVTGENVRLLTELEDAIETRYRSGSALFADLIKVQVEKARLDDRLAALRDRRRVESAWLSSLLNLPADEYLPWPRVGAYEAVMVDETTLTDMLEDLNPELKAAESRIEAARLRAALARREGLPDFMLGVGWMVMPGMNGGGDESDVGLMAGLTLPVWRGRVRAGIREAAAMAEAAEMERDAMSNRLRAELSMAVFEFRDAERRIKLYTDSLVPKAEQAMDAAMAAYAQGSAELMALVDAQRTLLEFRLQAARAAADREIALADIGCCVGTHDVGLLMEERRISD